VIENGWQLAISVVMVLFTVVMVAVEWSVSQARSRRR
jgi:hypothetical protein